MAVDSTALNLAQYALFTNEPQLARSAAFSILQHGSILEDLPLRTSPTLMHRTTRFLSGAFPTINWSKLNEEPTGVGGNPTPYDEQIYFLRNFIDVDQSYIDAFERSGGPLGDPRAARLKVYLESLAYDVNDKFINNNPVSGEQDCFAGLRYRLDNASAWGVESEMKVDAGAVDLREANMTAATANVFVNRLSEVIDNMGGSDGNGVVLYMNETMKRRFAMAIRMMGAGAGFSTTTDAFGRTIDLFRGAKVQVIGRKADNSTQIITSTETSAGADGASTYTSIYAVRYGVDNGVSGWQFRSLGEAIRPVGLLDNGVINRTVIDWGIGLWIPTTRAFGRLYGIRLA